MEMFGETFRGGSFWAGVVSGGLYQMQDTVALRKGQLNKRDYALHTAENVTGAVGTIAGIEYGALLGTSIMPGVGTVAGSIIGGLLGDRVGRAVGTRAGNLVLSNDKLPTTQ